LISNTAPVAFGALGTVDHAGEDHRPRFAGAQFDGGTTTAFFSLIVPFWLIAASPGGGAKAVWPAVWSPAAARRRTVLGEQLHRMMLVDIIAAVVSISR
jgi:L-lactate permease